MKSEAAFQLARAQHALGQFEDAHRKYEHAVALNPKNVMAQYGLAQIKYGLFQGTDQAQQHDAIRILKMINTDLMPNNVDVLYVVFERREFQSFHSFIFQFRQKNITRISYSYGKNTTRIQTQT